MAEGESLGNAYVTIRPDTKGFENEAGSKIGSALGGAAKVGIAAFAGLTVAAGAFGKRAVAEGTEAAQAMGQTEAAIKSTGGAANVTSEHISNLAGRLGVLAGVDDEAVQAGQNLLLTFTSIRNEVGKGNDIFDQASKAMLDVSARMGTDASGAAIQLGKALNDPIKGVTALTRIGVSFTEAQKTQIAAMVESGNLIGAQKVILAELNKEFGGSAEAMGKNIAPGERLALLFNNVAEEVGGSLIPVLNSLLPAVTPVITALGPALGGVAETLAPLLGAVATMIGKTVVPVIEQLLPTLEVVIGALGEGLTNALVGIAPLLAALAEVFSRVLVALAPLLPALGSIVGILAGALVPILNVLTPILVPLAPFILGLIGALKVWTAVQLALNFALSANPIGLIVIGIAALVAGAIAAYQHLKPVRDVFDAIGRAIGWVIDRIKDAIQWFGKLKIPDWLTPGSPAPLETALWGIGNAFKTIARAPSPFEFAAPVLPRAGGVVSGATAVAGGATVLQVNLDGETVARVVYDHMKRMERQQGPLFAGT